MENKSSSSFVCNVLTSKLTIGSKKNLFRMYVFFMVTLMAMVLTACGDDDENGNDNSDKDVISIYNQWVSTEVDNLNSFLEYKGSKEVKEYVFDFTEKGKASIYIKYVNDNQWYYYRESICSINEHNVSSGKIQGSLGVMPYTINGNMATIDINGQSFQFKLIYGIVPVEELFFCESGKIWEGIISKYYYDRWGVTGDHYRTVIELIADPLYRTKGTGYEVDYDMNDPRGSYWYSEFTWRVSKRVIELRYADTNYEPVYISDYYLTDNRFEGYMDDGTNSEIKFSLYLVKDFNWDYFIKYPDYAPRQMAPGMNNAPQSENVILGDIDEATGNVKFASKGAFAKKPVEAAESK